MEKLNFNQLAFESPEHDGAYWYLPTDEHYKEIVEWLSTLQDSFRVHIGKMAIIRKSIPDSIYEVVVRFNKENRMIHYCFRNAKKYEMESSESDE